MWELLKENWWLTFIALAYLASAAGNVFQRAVQKAAAQQEPERPQRRSGPRRPPPRHDATEAAIESEPDVAAEIRRIMGIDLVPARREVREAPEPAPVEVAEFVDPLGHGGDLAERLARADAEREARYTSSITDRAQNLGAAIRDRYAAQSADSLAADAPRGKRRPRRILVFDRRHLVDAIVAREVLGPPRALQPYGRDRSDS